ncbi:MAG: histidinol-phosphate transaminase [Clostridiales bacterium]|nr:histidinol-phosphate transaminase [Clostridiales bacterium]
MSWENNVRKVVPYTPGDQPNKAGMIKINTNECPYPPAPGVQKVLAETDISKYRLYPDTTAAPLAKALADYYGVSEKQVFVGVGSDDVISMSFLTFFHGDKPILFPDITYSFYDVWAELYRIPYEMIPLHADFRIHAEDYKRPNGGIIFPNPNAPTGVFEDLSVVEEIIASNPDVVVMVDEAYVDFGGQSALPLLNKYDNLLIVRTFSKSRAMAGMRIGFAIGNEKLIKYLSDVKFSFNSYTMNLPSILCGVEAVRNDAYFKETLRKVIATRERVKKELKELGFTFPDSYTNFIFATHKSRSAKDIYEALKVRDIYVRHFNKPEIDNYLRISIGTDEEMDTVLAFLRDYLK